MGNIFSQGIFSRGGGGGGSSVTREIWGYQDFTAGTIVSVNVTLTVNQNGIDAPFVPINITGKGFIVRKDALKEYAYTGTSKLFSSKVKISSITNDSVVLSGVPNVSWGDIRVYYGIQGEMPLGYSLPPKIISPSALEELDPIIATQTELDTGLSGKENSFVKNTAFNKNFGTSAGTVTEGNDARILDAFQKSTDTLDDITAGTTNKHFTATDESKLDGIEALADVTDATNVAGAGAVMDTDFTANGLMARTGSGSYVNRTLTGTTNQVNVANGDGVSGNPTFSLPQSINTTATVQFGKVGAGTATAEAPLHTKYSVPSGSYALRVEGGSVTNAQIYSTGATFGIALVTNNTDSGKYALSLANSSSNIFVVKNDGKIGIGTVAPDYKIDLAANSSSDTEKIRFGGHNSLEGGGIIWEPNFGTYTKKSAGVIAYNDGNFFRMGLRFYTSGTLDVSTDYTSKLEITGLGNIVCKSTTGALIVNTLTTTERNSLSAVNGMIIYNTTDNQFNFRENGAWVTK